MTLALTLDLWHVLNMPKRSSTPDENPYETDPVDELAAESEHEAPPEKNPAAVALGRLGGLKGGKARAAKLSAKKRSEIAKKAALTRWKKQE